MVKLACTTLLSVLVVAMISEVSHRSRLPLQKMPSVDRGPPECANAPVLLDLAMEPRKIISSVSTLIDFE
jgi:hypothetical protein